MYSIKLTRIAAEHLRHIDAKSRSQILNKIEDLKMKPLLLGIPLKGTLKEYRSISPAGQRYRILYTFEELQIVVVIIVVGTRETGNKKDIYELLKKYVRIGLLGEHSADEREGCWHGAEE